MCIDYTVPEKKGIPRFIFLTKDHHVHPKRFTQKKSLLEF